MRAYVEAVVARLGAIGFLGGVRTRSVPNSYGDFNDMYQHLGDAFVAEVDALIVSAEKRA